MYIERFLTVFGQCINVLNYMIQYFALTCALCIEITTGHDFEVNTSRRLPPWLSTFWVVT